MIGTSRFKSRRAAHLGRHRGRVGERLDRQSQLAYTSSDRRVEVRRPVLVRSRSRCPRDAETRSLPSRASSRTAGRRGLAPDAGRCLVHHQNPRMCVHVARVDTSAPRAGACRASRRIGRSPGRSESECPPSAPRLARRAKTFRVAPLPLKPNGMRMDADVPATPGNAF